MRDNGVFHYIILIFIVILLAFFLLVSVWAAYNDASEGQVMFKPRAYLPVVNVAKHNGNMARNGGFEAGLECNVRWWEWSTGEVSEECFTETRTPEEWVGWWVNGRPCDLNEVFVSGRPEIRLAEPLPDPLRIYEGQQALTFFSFWRCHYGGVYQVVDVVPGRFYRAEVYAHHWSSYCSYKPHDPPHDKECRNPVPWWSKTRVGLDWQAKQNYDSLSLVWGEGEEIYGVYGDAIKSPVVQAVFPLMTVWIESNASWPYKHNDWYADAVRVYEVMPAESEFSTMGDEER